MYDVIIIWAWSAGLTAWLYASRYWMSNVIIWELLWWALTYAHKVENFPWFENISWFDIMDKLLNQAKNFWSEIIQDKIVDITKIDNYFLVKTSFQKEFQTKTILIAIWNKHRKLWVLWEDELIWKWVSYCATCDWMFFRNKEVALVWWWDSALSEALYLSTICSKIYLIHRRDSFKAAKSWVEQVESKENIKILKNTKITEIKWKENVEWVVLDNWDLLKLDWVFIDIWNEPDTKIFDKFNLLLDEDWYIIVDKTQKTSIDWIWAAWDITTNSNKFKQSIVAASEWAVAINNIYEKLLN